MKTFKKIISSILIILALAMTISAVGCNNGGGGDKGPAMSLDKTSFNIYAFEQETITVESDSNAEITWSITNGDVATLTTDGKTATIFGVRRGETTVIAKQGKNSVSCKIMIFPAQDVLAVNITSPLTLNLKVNETSQVTTAITYAGVSFDKASLEFKVAQDSPLGAVTVSESGLVTAVEQGVATVMVRANFGDTYSEWAEATVYVFPEDYNNDDQQAPSIDGGYIEDPFGGYEG